MGEHDLHLEEQELCARVRRELKVREEVYLLGQDAEVQEVQHGEVREHFE